MRLNATWVAGCFVFLFILSIVAILFSEGITSHSTAVVTPHTALLLLLVPQALSLPSYPYLDGLRPLWVLLLPLLGFPAPTSYDDRIQPSPNGANRFQGRSPSTSTKPCATRKG